MKKTFLLVAAAISTGILFGQSQRLVFIEEFTQASCGPCASQNPAFNTLLSNNSAKAVSVKYQTDWPGTDPMNAQNPKDAGARVTYYGVSSVPNAIQDGVSKGLPSNVTQTTIDQSYNTASPFTIQVKHWFNAANDSIYIFCEATASQANTMTTPKLRIAMVEKTITFTNAPGSNGEKVFYSVMRKMYPTAAGTTLAGSWAVNDKKTVTFKAKIPTYIYKKAEIAVVAWIQDDNNKSVKQAGYSSAPSTPVAAAPLADFSADVVSSCDGIVKFQDNSALFPTSWSWDFGDGTSSTQQNPTHKYNSNGNYTVIMTATNANGSNQAVKNAYVTVNMSGAAPTASDVKRCGAGVVNLSATAANGGTLNWYDAAGAMVNTGTTYSPNISGTTNFWVTELTPNAVKSEGPATNSIGAGSTFTATVTHGLYFDVLKPCKLVSVVCYASAAGTKTIQVVDAAGNIIQTASLSVPSGTSTVTLNFNLPAGTGYLLQCTNPANLYRNTAGAVYPYNVSGVVKITSADIAGAYYYFFYDWKVQQNPCASPSKMVSGIDSCNTTGIAEASMMNSLSVFPNPSSGAFTATFNTMVTDNYVVKITNTLGQVIFEESLVNFSGEYAKQMNLASYGKGIFMLSVINSQNEAVQKVLVQ